VSRRLPRVGIVSVAQPLDQVLYSSLFSIELEISPIRLWNFNIPPFSFPILTNVWTGHHVHRGGPVLDNCFDVVEITIETLIQILRL